MGMGLALGGAALLPGRSWGLGKRSKFRFAQLKLGNWNPRPTALRRMAWEIEKRTSISVNLEPLPVTLTSKKLHETPFMYLAGDREFPVPSKREVQALRRYLTYGGFLLIDSAEGNTKGAFDRSVRRLVDAIYPPPAKRLQLVPGDHVVYKSFYLLQRPVGRVAISAAMEGVFRDGRMAVAYTQNDLGGAWARDNFGNWQYQCVPGGSRQRELSFRMGINTVMYALCLNYKADQVHVPFIMRRRRWRTNDGSRRVIIPPRRAPKKRRKR
jgi:hypothetical protein